MYAVPNLLNSATDTHAASSIPAAVRRVLKKQGFVPDTFITDKLPSYGAALKDLGLAKHHDLGVPGSGIGASLDKLYAARTRQAALEIRPSGAWHNPNTVNAGVITPTRT